MKPHTLEFMQLIENHKDPEKAMRIAVDIFRRMVAGESLESIGESYGVPPEKIRELEA
jgi:predicted urease superfamily metal-dependent hydrolase